MALENMVSLHTLCIENEAQNNKNNYGTNDEVSQSKNNLILQKMKTGPKRDIRPFCTKAFGYQLQVLQVSQKNLNSSLPSKN